ncbi:MAG: hypothetical protein LKCHEGNO_02975 [Burkholderiaceae bacterium]|nr:hypothetical protein [Burkholderiaceae bacterium]
MSLSLPAVDKHRLAGLQDGVYSIAMTLLVLELKLPAIGELGAHLSDAVLWSALVSLWPKLLTWLLSFAVLAIFWLGDVRALAAIAVVDRVLLRMGLLRLALVSLLPFSTAFMGEHGDRAPAAAVYAAHLFLLALAQSLRHLYLQRHPGVVTSANGATLSDAGLQAFVTLACSAAAVGLAFVVPGYNMLALLPIALLDPMRRFTRARGEAG